MNESALKEELLKVYNIYIEGFRSNDMNLINSIVHFPIAFLKEGKIEMLTNYPVNPKELKEQKEWHHSTDWNFEITAINDTDAHVTASAVRRKEDGSFIEKVGALYGFSKKNKEWKMNFLAEIIS